MKKWLVVIGFFLCAGQLAAQLAPPQSVATTDNVYALRWNPAGLSANSGSQFGISSLMQANSYDTLSYYFSSGTKGSASGLAIYQNGNSLAYRFGAGMELAKGSYFGYGIDFSKQMHAEFALGMIYRPAEFVSIGATMNNFTGSNGLNPNYRAGLALRPLGPRVTLAADALFKYNPVKSEYAVDSQINLSAEIVNGINLGAYYDTQTQTAGIGFGMNLSHFGASGYSDVSSSGTGLYNNGIGNVDYTEATRHSLFSHPKQNKYIILELNGPIIEGKPPLGLFGTAAGRSVASIIFQIDKYAKNDDIRGIVLFINNPTAGLAKLQEIREALQRFQASGKTVIAYMDRGGNSQYFLASVADKVYLNPAGDLWLTGVSAQMLFVKGLLHKAGIKAEFEHIGKYKSAADMFTEDTITTANAEQLNAYLDDFYETFTQAIAHSRNMDIDQIKSMVDNGPYSAKGALKAGLVDSLIYRDQLRPLVEDDGGKGSNTLISDSDYNKKSNWNYTWETPKKDKIAVIYAIGEITTGKSERSPFTGISNMGSETMVKAIKKARENSSVKAIVLRVDSPGGSALASDMIWREIAKTTTGEKAKPVIVSMSDVAGSGGYYIAVGADKILADPTTITGSIGVIGGKFSFEGLFDKFGIKTATIKRGENADFMGNFHDMSPGDHEKLYALISDTYDDFITKVSEGRGIPKDSVDQLGRGRIYSGLDAKDIGLVDEIGGIKEALQEAKSAAKIPEDEEVGLVYYPKYSFDFFDLLNDSGIFTGQTQLPHQLKQVMAELDRAQLLANEQVLYLLPYTLKINE